MGLRHAGIILLGQVNKRAGTKVVNAGGVHSVGKPMVFKSRDAVFAAPDRITAAANRHCSLPLWAGEQSHRGG